MNWCKNSWISYWVNGLF